MVIYSATNKEYGITARVVDRGTDVESHIRFAVILRDDDANEDLPSIRFYAEQDRAENFAALLVSLTPSANRV